MRAKIVVALCALILMACGGKKDDDKKSKDNGPGDQNEEREDNVNGPGSLQVEGDAGTVAINLQAVNALDIENSQGDKAATAGTLAIGASLSLLDGESFNNIPADVASIEGASTSVISGPPDGFKIIVKEISFSGDKSHTTVFSSKEGVELAIEGASIDLTKLIADAKEAGNKAEGDGLALQVEVGDYKEVVLKLEGRGYIKGCIKGLFEDHNLPEDTNVITELSGTHEYCTQEGKDLYTMALSKDGGFKSTDSIPKNSDFEKTSSSGKKAEWMKIQIGKHPNWPKDFDWYEDDIDQPIHPPSTDEKEEVELTYEVSGGFKVEKDKEITLTMLIDMNRLLRYDNGAKDHPTDFPTHRNPSFFFDSTFQGNSSIFVGKPGKIYGYEITSLVCEDSNLDKSDIDNPVCNGNGFFPVNTWMTLITDKDGKPQSLMILPEDDSRLTTLVGGHYRWSGDPWVFAGSGASVSDIRYNNDRDDGKEMFRGTIFDFPADLEKYSPSNPGPFMVYWDLHDEDDKDRTGKNIYPNSATGFPHHKDKGGVAFVWRRL